MLISVRHVTRYRYAESVSYTIQSLRLTPASFKGQRVLDWQVRAGGAKPSLQYRDGFGNIVHLITVNVRHEELVIEAGGTIETQDSNGVVAGLA
jgi:transglutaminase-like putative cysteine protease